MFHAFWHIQVEDLAKHDLSTIVRSRSVDRRHANHVGLNISQFWKTSNRRYACEGIQSGLMISSKCKDLTVGLSDHSKQVLRDTEITRLLYISMKGQRLAGDITCHLRSDKNFRLGRIIESNSNSTTLGTFIDKDARDKRLFADCGYGRNLAKVRNRVCCNASTPTHDMPIELVIEYYNTVRDSIWHFGQNLAVVRSSHSECYKQNKTHRVLPELELVGRICGRASRVAAVQQSKKSLRSRVSS